MATRKQQQDNDEPTDRAEGQKASAAESEAKGDVQEKVDVEQEQGFVGTKVDPRPNSDYSLESGPDAPSNVEDDRTRAVQYGVDGGNVEANA